MLSLFIPEGSTSKQHLERMAGLTEGKESNILTTKGEDEQATLVTDAPRHRITLLTPVKCSSGFKLCHPKRPKCRPRSHGGKGRSPGMTRMRSWTYPLKKWTPMVKRHPSPMVSNKGCIFSLFLPTIFELFPVLRWMLSLSQWQGRWQNFDWLHFFIECLCIVKTKLSG